MNINAGKIYSFIIVICIIFLSMIFGSFIVSTVSKVDIPDQCKDWNKNHIMELSVLIGSVVSTGIIFWMKDTI